MQTVLQTVVQPVQTVVQPAQTVRPAQIAPAAAVVVGVGGAEIVAATPVVSDPVPRIAAEAQAAKMNAMASIVRVMNAQILNATIVQARRFQTNGRTIEVGIAVTKMPTNILRFISNVRRKTRKVAARLKMD